MKAPNIKESDGSPSDSLILGAFNSVGTQKDLLYRYLSGKPEFNDSRDLSEKVKSAKRTKALKGDYLRPR